MPLSLTSRDQQLFTETLRAMVRLDVAEPDSWEIGVLRALKPLLQAERGGFFYLTGTASGGVTEDYDRAVLKDYTAYYAERDPGLRRLAREPDPVFSRAQLFRGNLRPLQRSECHNDFFQPNGIADSVGIELPGNGSRSPGVLALHRGDFGSDAFAHRAPALLAMLYPAFLSGWRARAKLERGVTDLARLADALAEAAAIFTLDGRLVHANPPLREIVAGSARGEELTRVMGHVARGRGRLLVGGENPEGGGSPVPLLSGFRFQATLLDSLYPDPVVLVTTGMVRRNLPTAEALVQRLELTPRQAEVALLLAERLRNTEIASRLVISTHTARRHTEAVMAKLGVTDRHRVGDRLQELMSG